MKFINNHILFEDCKESLISCYGDIEIATKILNVTKYQKYRYKDLLGYVTSIEESFSSNIKNLISRKVGGNISKIDNILNLIKDCENTFIEKENSLEKEYIRLFSTIAYIKYNQKDRGSLSSINNRLTEIIKELSDSVDSYNVTMNELEGKIDSIIKKNSRLSNYYNLKRAKDSTETKKKRAIYKYHLAKSQNDNIDQSIKDIFGDAESAQRDEIEAKRKLAKEKSRIIASINIDDNQTQNSNHE